MGKINPLNEMSPTGGIFFVRFIYKNDKIGLKILD